MAVPRQSKAANLPLYLVVSATTRHLLPAQKTFTNFSAGARYFHFSLYNVTVKQKC